ncbi:hypothetical protein B566_EDAN010256 [Ephemera danica]|nr:hypothetical protein B566_EDAN010256 [Ephemera danica]
MSPRPDFIYRPLNMIELLVLLVTFCAAAPPTLDRPNHLAVFTSEFHNSTFVIIDKHVYLIDFENPLWQWTGNGRRMNYFHWATGQPDYFLTSDACMFVNSRGWLDDSCSEMYASPICE